MNKPAPVYVLFPYNFGFNVAAETLSVSLNQYKNHISPHFKNVPLRKITLKTCQDLLDTLDEQGKGKTLDDVHSILNMIFKAAVKNNLLQYNPLDMVFHTKLAQRFPRMRKSVYLSSPSARRNSLCLHLRCIRE